MKKIIFYVVLSFVVAGVFTSAFAQTNMPIPKIGIDVGTSQNPEDVSVTLQILLLMTILTLAPSIVIMTTCFLRTIIVFNFLKSALGTQQMPPSQLLAGLALFITFFVMAPTFNKINDQALQPYMNKKITLDSAVTGGMSHLRGFMFKNVRNEDLELFLNLSKSPKPKTREEVSTYVLIPAFAISELRAGFIMGFFLFIPFLVVDMVVASILMSMGMMMIPPMLISLPFKILLFVLVDGWNLIIGSIVRSFN